MAHHAFSDDRIRELDCPKCGIKGEPRIQHHDHYAGDGTYEPRHDEVLTLECRTCEYVETMETKAQAR